ncbi:MAG: hypothetical protein KME48_12865 [Candidatus Thiodiazotropha sp. (ex Ctena orbiculata)]|uniref:Uncharacterized protein n=1 Tax=Candidatus Thiodiazotropha taylori TaxID=2792791 RepID=A0A944QS59_9GAMM|nr:hypothetical protein [Candidatus Thiodiazotropha taylori]MBT3028035.1 hypothetical protein [Candidatus Thiodiazotropha taylori]MBT3035647.1 hypothetical protein [Candidatus Thiodiazotropha taylori]
MDLKSLTIITGAVIILLLGEQLLIAALEMVVGIDFIGFGLWTTLK